MLIDNLIAKFLYLLGLRRFPPLRDIIGMAASPDVSLRSVALKYFLDNYNRYPEYDAMMFADVAYLPALKTDGQSVMGTPKEVRSLHS